MPFGVHSAAATFQRTLDKVVGPELEPFVFSFLDDIIVVSKSLQDHFGQVFERLRNANFYINREKCNSLKKALKHLGHLVTQNGISTDPDKLHAIKNLKPPNNIKELRRCPGTASWYRRFISGYTEIAQLLTSLLKKKKRWSWNTTEQEVFKELKRQQRARAQHRDFGYYRLLSSILKFRKRTPRT